jgi:hypothetical protein
MSKTHQSFDRKTGNFFIIIIFSHCRVKGFLLVRTLAKRPGILQIESINKIYLQAERSGTKLVR